MIEAVIFDFGGVLTSSPFEAFTRYEQKRGLPPGFLRGVNAVNAADNAWARFERAEIDAEAFDAAFAEESAARGARVPGREVIALLSGDVRPSMVAALRACKARFKVGCLTNTVPSAAGLRSVASSQRSRAVAEVMALFDAVVESSRTGIRKPDPAIYRRVCEALGVAPAACVYLDDLGVNCKPAAALGLTAIKVVDEAQALSDLSAATGLDFKEAA